MISVVGPIIGFFIFIIPKFIFIAIWSNDLEPTKIIFLFYEEMFLVSRIQNVLYGKWDIHLYSNFGDVNGFDNFLQCWNSGKLIKNFSGEISETKVVHRIAIFDASVTIFYYTK